jgi:1-deoxy-D-xylulose-5-phosphate synthase
VVTVEEGALMGGFGSAVLEAAQEAGVRADHVTRLGVPDRWIMHAERQEQLVEMGLDTDSMVSKAIELAERFGDRTESTRTPLASAR